MNPISPKVQFVMNRWIKTD